MAKRWQTFAVLAILFLACHHVGTSVSRSDNETDRHALLSFKSMLSDSSRELLASWNDSIDFCKWPGIACGRRHAQRVVSLDLGSFGLSGSISPAISNLTFLRNIDLSNNQFHGPIPPEIGRLFRLRHLNLSVNPLGGGIPATLSGCSELQYVHMVSSMLTGEIPTSLGNCSNIRVINLRNNSLTGHIPPALTSLPLLTVLVLSYNQLSGNIPDTIGNLSSLTALWLGENNLSGTISPSIGKLSKLITLDLDSNHVTGAIPSSVWNLSSLSRLSVAYNNLSGSIPENVGQRLPLIKAFDIYQNHLRGHVLTSLSNASHLEYISLGFNNLGGTIPPIFGRLQNLNILILPGNLFEAMDARGWRFLDGLTNCTNLRILDLGINNLGGMLPHSVANLSTNLQRLDMGDNQISGSISPEISNLIGLTLLDLGPNLLTGSIPVSIGMLRNMHLLDLDNNKLSGEIPSTLGNLAQLSELYLDYNQLSGAIPASLGNCQNLVLLNLESNKLTGGIPKEILTILTLSRGLYLAWNSLTGPMPLEVGNLRNLEALDISMNKLSGVIPSTIGECQELEQLLLRGNFFDGSIPSSLSELKGIQKLDLSQNNLSGKIPDFLQDFDFLVNLNLSFNNFDGAVPKLGVFANTSEISLLGNKNLCGGDPAMHLPDCPSHSPNRKHSSHLLIILVIGITGSLLFLFLLFCIFVSRCRRKSRSEDLPLITINELWMASYAELAGATDGFSGNNIIGSGSFATVYKGKFCDDDGIKVVAVKVLNLQMKGATKSFVAECEAMRNIRHRNLVKILTVCSGMDFRGNEFKALVLEFMANGSLDDWLHPKENEGSERERLTLTQRLNIAIDVAMALDYLHNHSEPPIIHCDLKPSNVLLDKDMTAHVGDFGLARILKNIASKPSHYSTSSIGLKGTVGYVPPEYGMANRVSTHGDVYSYGILLLEMFTSKSPTGSIFGEGLSLQMFVRMALPEQVADVIDPQLLSTEDGQETNDSKHIDSARAIECVASVLQVGIFCSNEEPAKRPDIGEATRELCNIRKYFLEILDHDS